MNDKPRSDHSDRSKQERIERLRQRLDNMQIDPKLAGILKGLLDLLSDEL